MELCFIRDVKFPEPNQRKVCQSSLSIQDPRKSPGS
jgi:hypothetical protein